VLGGGGALGAFQAGVYEALEEAGREPDRLVGTSIGALNAALFAGNPPERRLECLRAFWDMVAEPRLAPAAWSGDARRIVKAVFALHARPGPSGFVPPAPAPALPAEPGLRSPSLYHLGPAFATLRRLVDFERIGNDGPQLAVHFTELGTGAPVSVDSASDRLRPEHLVASMGLLPDFPPTEIDGRWFCDGGFSANLPLNAVLDPPPKADVLCLAVDLLGEPGAPMFSRQHAGALRRSPIRQPDPLAPRDLRKPLCGS
jgi:NTE family protein